MAASRPQFADRSKPQGRRHGVPAPLWLYGQALLWQRLFVKGGKWCGRWWVGDRRVNRVLGPARKPASRDGLTRSQAERELRRRMESELPSVSRRDRLSVGDAGRRYVDHLEHVMERKPSTVQDYRGYLMRHLDPYFGDGPIDRIDADRVAAYMKAKRVEHLAAKTVQNHLNFLHGVFAFAVKRGWATTNPVALVDRPRKSLTKSRRLRFLQPEELDAVIRSTPSDALGVVERPLYLCAAMTGMRQGELLAARWVDIDWPARRVRVADNFTRGKFGTPKSDHGRSIPMADRLASELERHFQRSNFQGDDDFVFSHPETGKVLDPSKLRKRFGSTVARARVHEITFHELRHTFGTQMAAAGAPLRAMQGGWGTPTRRRPRSIRTTPPTRLAAQLSPSAHSARAETSRKPCSRGISRLTLCRRTA